MTDLDLFSEPKKVSAPAAVSEGDTLYTLRSLPPSPTDAGYLVEVADAQKRTSKNGKFYLCMIYKVLDHVPDWDEDDHDSENFFLFDEDGRPLKEETNAPTPYYYFYDLCRACGKDTIKSPKELIGSKLRIIKGENKNNPKYTNVVGHKKASADAMPSESPIEMKARLMQEAKEKDAVPF